MARAAGCSARNAGNTSCSNLSARNYSICVTIRVSCVDLGRDRRHAKIRAELHERMFAWLRARKIRITVPNELIERQTNTHKTRGFLFGVW